MYTRAYRDGGPQAYLEQNLEKRRDAEGYIGTCKALGTKCVRNRGNDNSPSNPYNCTYLRGDNAGQSVSGKMSDKQYRIDCEVRACV